MPDYTSLDTIEGWLDAIDQQCTDESIRLKGITYDRASNHSFGFKLGTEQVAFSVIAPSQFISSKIGDKDKFIPPKFQIQNATSTTTLTPSQQAFIDVLRKGLENVSADDKPVLIDMATLTPTPAYFSDAVDGVSVISALADLLKSESLREKKVIIRLLVGDPGSRTWQEVEDACESIFRVFDGRIHRESKIPHPSLKLYLGFYSPDFAPNDDTDVAAVKAFISKVTQSPILGVVNLGLKIFGKTDANKLVEPLMQGETISALPSITWNHGKLLAVNGQTLMTGGINYYTEYTMESKHDISDTAVRIHGDAAVSGHRWADYFWKYLTKRSSTDNHSRCRVLNVQDDNCWWDEDDPVTIPNSSFIAKSIAEKRLETLTITKLGDWHGNMNKIQYPVQIIDCLRDIIFNIAWVKLGQSDSKFDPGTGILAGIARTTDLGRGALFNTLMTAFNDETISKSKNLPDLGINANAWASRYVRTKTIASAVDSIVISQQMLVQAFKDVPKEYKKIVYQANCVLNGKAVDSPQEIDKVKWNTPWDGYVWPYDLLVALARALGRISASTKPDRFTEKPKGLVEPPETATEQPKSAIKPPHGDYYRDSKGIFIIMTTDNPAGSHNDGWQDEVKIAEIKKRLRVIMYTLPKDQGGIPVEKIDNTIKDYLHFKRTATSESGTDLYNHSKVVVVDGRLMYVGSDNAYPNYNEEHGVWIEDQATIDGYLGGFMEDFWRVCATPTLKDWTDK